MTSWFVAIDGRQEGPYPTSDILKNLQNGVYGPNTYVWRQGFQNWLEISQCPELSMQSFSPPPVMPSSGSADEIDHEIIGSEMQFVEIELDPQESVVAEAGSMMYMSDHIEMQTIFGDGSESANAGLFDRMLGAGKRLITGESLFSTIFTYQGPGKGKVAFAAPYPGKIIPLDLNELGGKLICQKDAFLCAAKGVSIGIEFQKKIGTALFGGEGFIMQKLEGNGKVFVHAGGTIIQKELQAGETLRVDTGCLVAMTQNVSYDIQYVGNVKSAIFGGEGFFFATVGGPGHIWLQSLPFSRLAGRMLRAAPRSSSGSATKDEGSILGEFGNLFQR
jgi:uncharacterized protein (TIGR00266 family)